MSVGTPSKAWATSSAIECLLAAYRSADQAEPCGLLFGVVEESAIRVRSAVALENVHPRPWEAFRFAQAESLEAVRSARERGERIVGIWHGHLRGAPRPGRADRMLLEKEDVDDLASKPPLLVIVGRGQGPAPVVRAWVHGERAPREIPLAR